MEAKPLFRHIASLTILMIICTSCIFMKTSAYNDIDIQRQGSLTVCFGKDGNGFSGVKFCLYRVADISETGGWILSGDFRDYPVSLENQNSSGWRALAQTLAAYTARDSLNPLQTEKTASDGCASFSGLTVGLYLITGERFAEEGKIYTPEPLLVNLPAPTQDNYEWNYDVKISCKFDSADSSDDTVKRKVIKIWADDGNEDNRPEDIYVQLLENGSVADTVTLSRDNNWEYMWENLNGSSRWQIAEAKTAEGYTVSVVQEGITFIITNTYPPDTNPPDELPQTGMPWLPVPLLACGGLLLVLLGVLVRCRRSNHDE